ncbi:trypsin-like peptidase domain-containing protein [Leisingera aquaemixtae]|uniref:alpha/beta fold hydrolase n=1 Tax=Leisingera aquaemixtae TaxID=1396826 RepID=UPI001C9789ED|nr:alpha/beta fold hydrolase [Leisingera aquaemixtae]MBY6068816.1 trypsin-like peptidase domain-containing protein [Leisingera aquaemixtae]
MERMNDEQIERHLFEGTNKSELRELLGSEVYDSLRVEAVPPKSHDGDLTQEIFGFGTGNKPNVYILPGIMGSKLSARVGGNDDLIWFDPVDIGRGGVARLEFGKEPDPVVASGTFWAAYGTLRLRLRVRGYSVKFLPYDWRKSISDIADELRSKVEGNEDHGAVLVAHSMGGLVARQIAALDTDEVVKRVVTIGTPNFGSYSPVQVFRVASDMLNKIGWLDQKHTPSDIAKKYLRHFPGLVEMMPDPSKRPSELYYDASYWPNGGARPNKSTLESALAAKSKLPTPDYRFHQIIGFGQETAVAADNNGSELTYSYSNRGDGTVPVDLAQVKHVPQYFVEDTHAGMLNRQDVARAVDDLIANGETNVISSTAPSTLIEAETFSVSRSDKEIRDANRTAQRPEDPDALEILSEYLPKPTPQPKGNDQDRTTGGARGTEMADMFKKIGGYPLTVLLQASATWRGEPETTIFETTGRHVRETETRMQKYAERKLQQLRSIVEEAPLERVLPERLQKIVADSEENHFGAINSLLNERVMGEAEEFLSVLYLKRAPIVSRSVGRVVRRVSGIGFGTGFLVAPGVLMTNHHVLPNSSSARTAAIQFDFELNFRNREMAPEQFELLPDKLFYADKALDFAVVAVEPVSSKSGRPLDDFGYLPLDGGEGKITIGKPVNIIQHPNAEQKQAVFRNAELKDLPANALDANAQFTSSPSDVAAHYVADTKPGASGSPVFSDAWEVIALHHSAVAIIKDGKFRMKDQSFRHPNDITDDDEVDWQANEGIRISRITKHLEDLLTKSSPLLSRSEIDLVQLILRVGRQAKQCGHFVRPMPYPVLTQFENEPVSSETGNGAAQTAPESEALKAKALELEGLLDRVKKAIARIGGANRAMSPTGWDGAMSVDGSGVAHGSNGLVISYRGDANSPYGKSATQNQRPFNSIVLHHNSPTHSTNWLINYQIDGDMARGGHFGYHFYIDPNGEIFQGAPLTKRTNHVKRPNHAKRKAFGRIASNNGSIGVTCVKAGPHYSPTHAQIAAQDALVTALAAAYDIPLSNVFGHGEIQSDRDHREGASQASKFRGSGNAFSSNEAFRPDDDLDDSALEMDLYPRPSADDGYEGAARKIDWEDDDDLSKEAIPKNVSAIQPPANFSVGAESLSTSLVYSNAGAIRNKPCTANLEARLVQAVEAVYGPGYKISIYSGGQDRKGHGNKRTGSIRHDDYGQGGRAADIYLHDASGAQVTGINLAKLGQYWLAVGYGCVGHEMGGGGIHLDEWVPPPQGGGRFWTYRASDAQPWGAQARSMLARGANGIYP